MEPLLLAGVGYLLGSIPSGLAAGKLRGVDLRERGSGRTGATNVLRTLGFRIAAVVLLADLAKGGIAVALASLVTDPPAAQVGAALGAVVGHSWPLFGRLPGGRGVTPGMGALLVMVPWLALAGVSLFVLISLASRYVSLGSVVGTAATGATLVVLAFTGMQPWQYAVYGVGGVAIIVLRHRDNIRRILAGEERRLGKGA